MSDHLVRNCFCVHKRNSVMWDFRLLKLQKRVSIKYYWQIASVSNISVFLHFDRSLNSCQFDDGRPVIFLLVNFVFRYLLVKDIETLSQTLYFSKNTDWVLLDRSYLLLNSDNLAITFLIFAMKINRFSNRLCTSVSIISSCSNGHLMWFNECENFFSRKNNFNVIIFIFSKKIEHNIKLYAI